MIYKSYQIENNIQILKENLVLFYGENLGLKILFKNKIKLENKKCEIISFNQEEIIKNHNLLFNELNNISLFEKEKVFLIDQVNEKILKLIEESIDYIDNQRVFSICDLLDKSSKIKKFFETSKMCAIIPCYKDNELTIKKLIQEKLRNFKGLNTININLIMDNCALDRVKLNNELEKICACFDNKIIDTDKLNSLMNNVSNDDFNELRDQALLGNKKKTNKLLSETIIEPEKNIYYLSVINQRLNKLLDVNFEDKSIDLENAIKNLKPPIFWKDKPNFIEQIKKWERKKLHKIIKKTYNLELEIKSNSLIKTNVQIRKLIVDICTLANAS